MFRKPELDATTAANDRGLLPAGMADHRGTSSQNRHVLIKEVQSFEAGQICLIKTMEMCMLKFQALGE
jgi:hypothetical protein